MGALSEAGELKLAELFVSLIILGLIPYLVAKNTRQHNKGTEERNLQNETLKIVLSNQDRMNEKLDGVVEHVEELRTLRNSDKEEFFKLLEWKLKHDAQIERDRDISDSH